MSDGGWFFGGGEKAACDGGCICMSIPRYPGICLSEGWYADLTVYFCCFYSIFSCMSTDHDDDDDDHDYDDSV